MKEKLCTFIQTILKFVPKDPIHNKSSMVQVMAWHLTGNKPLPHADSDLQHHKASLGHNEFTNIFQLIYFMWHEVSQST